jgi:HD superfamily phosphohydrolase
LLKIFNDPVHGLIEVPVGLVLELIDHPWVQRLRRIRQVALSNLVYAGAQHSRFSHALGAMHLTRTALGLLEQKGVPLSPEEREATLAAILLHDIGHGPFSHALESVLVPHLRHEQMGQLLLEALDRQFDGRLALARRIFSGDYPRPFLHQLIASQLDMDRMDYLMRDSFFTGVQEGIVGTERILKTLYVHQDRLVVEEKGIYSVEKFIVARRLMYWQVYLHKTALVAENLLVLVLGRVRELLRRGVDLPCDAHLRWLLTAERPEVPELIDRFTAIDDTEIVYGLKSWRSCADPILADLSRRILDRRLLKIKFFPNEISDDFLLFIKKYYQEKLGLSDEALPYYVFARKASNRAYVRQSGEPIQILYKDGRIRELDEASDLENIGALSREVVKHYLCYPGAEAPFPAGT